MKVKDAEALKLIKRRLELVGNIGDEQSLTLVRSVRGHLDNLQLPSPL